MESKTPPVSSVRLPPRTKDEIEYIKNVTGIRALNEVVIQAVARWARDLKEGGR